MRRACDRRGFALVAALWLLVALSALGLSFSLAARERRLTAANALDLARARDAADAGLAHARARLAERTRVARERRAWMDPSLAMDPWGDLAALPADSVRLGDAHYRVTLADAGARLNVNTASAETMRRLFVALRIDAGAADRLAQAIADWRDRDDFRHARGAETADYLKAGAPVLPANTPFERLAELRWVRGMTPRVYERVRDHLTVVGPGQVSVNAADRPVLLALPGMTEEAVMVVLRAREQRRPVRTLQELATRLSPGARTVLVERMSELLPVAAFETRFALVTSEGWVEGGPARVRLDALVARGERGGMVTWRRVE